MLTYHYNKWIIIFSRYAEQVSLDDEVLVNENDEFIPERVVNISSLIMQGY